MANENLVSCEPIKRFFDINEGLDKMTGDILNGFRDIASNREAYPAANVKEGDSKYMVEVEMPGIDKEDLVVRIKGKYLLIKGEKKEENREKGESYLMVERSQGSFRRTFRFASELNTKKASAEFKNGILTVTLPKTKKEKPKEVNIKVD